MKRNIVDIINEVVDRIDNTIVGETPLNSAVSILTCDPKWASTSTNINGVKIKEVNKVDKYYEIVLNSAVIAPFLLSKPKFYHGTVVNTNTQIQSLEKNPLRPNVYPMVYLPETSRATTYYDRLRDAREMSGEIQLVLAVPFRTEWDSRELKDYCINPMIELADLIQKEIKKDKRLRLTSGFSVEQFSKLGSKVSTTAGANQGVVYNMINDYCSGVVVNFSLDVYPSFICKCCCEIPAIPVLEEV